MITKAVKSSDNKDPSRIGPLMISMWFQRALLSNLAVVCQS